MAFGITNRIRLGMATPDGASMLGGGDMSPGQTMSDASAVGSQDGSSQSISRSVGATQAGFSKGSKGPQKERQGHSIKSKTENTRPEPQGANKIKRIS
jgi:hypothetical protein